MYASDKAQTVPTPHLGWRSPPNTWEIGEIVAQGPQPNAVLFHVTTKTMPSSRHMPNPRLRSVACCSTTRRLPTHERMVPLLGGPPVENELESEVS